MLQQMLALILTVIRAKRLDLDGGSDGISVNLPTLSEEPNEPIPNQSREVAASQESSSPRISQNPSELQQPKTTFALKSGLFFNDHKRGFMLKVGPEFEVQKSFPFIRGAQLKFNLQFTLGAKNPVPTHSGFYSGGQIKAYEILVDHAFYFPKKNYTCYHQTLIGPNLVKPSPAVFVNRFGYQYRSSVKTTENNTTISPGRDSLVYSPKVGFLGFEGGGEIEIRQLCFGKTQQTEETSNQTQFALISSLSTDLPKTTQSPSWFGAGYLTIGVFLGGILFYILDKIHWSTYKPTGISRAPYSMIENLPEEDDYDSNNDD